MGGGTRRSMAAEPATCGKPRYYVLEMLPYPSGQFAHGARAQTTRLATRWRGTCGCWANNVLHPMGWDAFGLPAENAAIKNNVPPREWTAG